MHGSPVCTDLLDGRYEVGPPLGLGGQAAVHEGRQVSTGRPVAIKIAVDERPAVLARLQREAQHLALVDHRGVVAIYDSGVTPDGRPYLVLERLGGHTLHRELERGPMPPARAVRLIRGALDALQAVHDAGLVHRDLKPENLFLSDPGTPHERLVLLDFGIAVRPADVRLTRVGEIVGTPQYFAPEMSRGRGTTESPPVPATDVYQMALVLTEMLTGKMLCDGSLQECIVAHQSGIRLPPGLPRELASVLAVALRREPSGRFATATALRDALRDAQRSRTADTVLEGRPPPSRAGLGGTLAVLGFGIASVATAALLFVVAGTLGGVFIAIAADAGASSASVAAAPVLGTADEAPIPSAPVATPAAPVVVEEEAPVVPAKPVARPAVPTPAPIVVGSVVSPEPPPAVEAPRELPLPGASAPEAGAELPMFH